MKFTIGANLQDLIDNYNSECEPKKDSEGNVINCCECECADCEFYAENNFESDDLGYDNSEDEQTSLLRYGDYLSA